jgi:acetyltransferase
MLSKTKLLAEPTYDILRLNYTPLEPLFYPKTVAVVGASAQLNTVGYTLLWNLVNAPFHGTVYPVTPTTDDILGMPTFPRVADVPVELDLAIVASSMAELPAIVHDCAAANVKTVLLVSSGFRESGAITPDVKQQLRHLLQQSSMRLLGPGSLGIMNPRHGLNATLASALARPGNIGFISQSGALCRSILNWSFQENVGFSQVIAIGSMVDIDWGDLIRYLGNDPYTQSIVIHMETLGNARSFLAAAREIAGSKPIILLKGGQTEAAIKAALSHSGEMPGSDQVFNAALRRCGVLRVHRISELFNMAEVLAKREFQSTGARLSIITNSGGLGVLATDALMATGGQLATLSEITIARLNHLLPPEWSHQNPIDILGDADGERFQKTLQIVAQDANTDGVLVIFTPQGAADPTDTAERLKDSIKQLQTAPLTDKPILASWMGGSEVMAAEAILNRYQIPTYPYPDSAARLFNLMNRHSYNLRGMVELPTRDIDSVSCNADRALARDIIQAARRAEQSRLSPVETQSVLQAYGIPVLQTEMATSEERAIAKAEQLGYPVVLKFPYNPGHHTPDEGGVQLNLTNSEAVRHAYRQLAEREHTEMVLVQPMLERNGAYELMVSSTVDPNFGPVLTFGKGGRLLEVYQDRAVALPPLNEALARRTIEQTKIFQALSGNKGYPSIAIEALEQLLVNLSWLVVEHPIIKSVHINPLWAMPVCESQENSESLGLPQPLQFMVLDAQITLHEAHAGGDPLPAPALMPYPSELVTPLVLAPGQDAGDHLSTEPAIVTLRPAGPDDEASISDFLDRLSDHSVYLQHCNLLPQDPRQRLQRLRQLCFLDYDRNIALVAEWKHPLGGTSEIVALARLNGLHGGNTATVALVVADALQGRGLGTAMLKTLVNFAHSRGIEHIQASLLAENTVLQGVLEHVGFDLQAAGNYITATLDLPAMAGQTG